MIFSSSLLENAVNEISRLPGIGKKTALRLVLHLLKQEEPQVEALSDALLNMRRNSRFCRRCNNISDTEVCNICQDTSRKQRLICVVENIRDVMAIESTQQYSGLYHVLGGVISPLDGIGPDQLGIGMLIDRVKKEETEEIIFALSPNIQGDTTLYYIQKQLQQQPMKFTTISRGIAFGGELEYADEMTLARSIAARQPIDQYVKA